MKNNWIQTTIIKGRGLGRKIGFPTINLDITRLKINIKTGVYLTEVKFQNNSLFGLLYYGPRLVHDENINILEIYLLNFNNRITSKTIHFRIFDFIRKEKSFDTVEELKSQLKKDVKSAEKILRNYSK